MVMTIGASLFAPQLILSPGRVNDMTSTMELENAHEITFLRPDLKNRISVNRGERTHQQLSIGLCNKDFNICIVVMINYMTNTCTSK